MRGLVSSSLPNWARLAGAAAIVTIVAVIADTFGVLFSLGVTAVGAALTAGVLMLRSPSEAHPVDVFDARVGWDALHAEARRSRRYGRTFVLLATAGDRDTASAVQSLLRTPDRAWLDGPNVYILLTECDRAQALGFINRARSAMSAAFDPKEVKLAAFPTDAVTLGALLEALEPSTSVLLQASHTREVA